MTSTSCRAFAWLLACCYVISGAASYGSFINYGDFGPDPLPAYTMYNDVRESSGTDPVPPESRYNAPTLSGDRLVFTPSQFVAEASPSVGLADTIDVQLNTQIMAREDNGVVAGGYTALNIDEWGSYSFFPGGSSATQVKATLVVGIEILEVDGSPVPSPGSPIWDIMETEVFEANALDDPADDTWQNNAFIDFTSILDDNLDDWEFGVTKANIVIDNRLQALAEANPPTIAFIDKKGFEISPVPNPNPDFVPEPSSVALVSLLIAGALGYRRFA